MKWMIMKTELIQYFHIYNKSHPSPNKQLRHSFSGPVVTF